MSNTWDVLVVVNARNGGGQNSDFLYLNAGQVKMTVSVYLPREMEPLKAYKVLAWKGCSLSWFKTKTHETFGGGGWSGSQVCP